MLADAWHGGTPELNTLYSNCTYPVNEYFWLNDLHPTYVVHMLLAKEVAEMLATGDALRA
jgi:phospholipase/lecithinase/hemolysin